MFNLPSLESLYYLGGFGAGTLGTVVAQLSFPDVSVYLYGGIGAALLMGVGVALAGDYYV